MTDQTPTTLEPQVGLQRRVGRRLPAPWRVDRYDTGDGRVECRVLAHDHNLVCDGVTEHAAAEIVASRNEGTVAADVADVQRRWQDALDAAHAETERVREHWQAECAAAIKAADDLRARLAETRSVAGQQLGLSAA